MSYSLVNWTSIIFGDIDDNKRQSDELIIKEKDHNNWLRYRIAFWFVGKSSRKIFAKYPMEAERTKLIHKVINGKYHIYYNPKYESSITVKDINGMIIVQSNYENSIKQLQLKESRFLSDTDYAHVLL